MFTPIIDQQNIIMDIFCAQGQKISIYPNFIIEGAIKHFLNDFIERDENIEQIFKSDKIRIIYKFVSESFIREYQDYITNWEKFWTYFKASEQFIKECPHKCWYEISKYQKLSERFIHEYRDQVDWDRISEFQKLSKEFCYEHRKQVNWDIIIYYQDSYWKETISDQLRKKLYYKPCIV